MKSATPVTTVVRCLLDLRDRLAALKSRLANLEASTTVNIHNYLSLIIKRDPGNPKRVLLLDGVGAHDIVGDSHYADAYSSWHQDLNTFARVRDGDVARLYDQKNLSWQLTSTVVAHEETTEHSELVLANSTLAKMGFQTNTRAWVGKVRCYWGTFHNDIPSAVLPPAAGYVNIDRLSSGGAVVRRNKFEECGGTRFKSIGGQVLDNSFKRTNAISIVIWPGWLEGSVGLRDVLVEGNMFSNMSILHNVHVGPGTSNITVKK